VRSGQHAGVTQTGVERQHAYPGHDPGQALLLLSHRHLTGRDDRLGLRGKRDRIGAAGK
jgi:hypothetical protein